MNLRRNRCKPEKWEFASRLRKNLTSSERAIWELIRRKSLGVRVHRQKLILGYIVDFWIPKVALAIEIDGSYHELPKQKAWDHQRDKALLAIGIRTLRYQSHLAPTEIFRRLKQELANHG